MSNELPDIRQRLALNRYHTDEQHPHIEVNQELVRKHNIGRVLINICPARVYSFDNNGDVKADYAACLECGTCRAVAPEGALTWHYPRGGKGIAFRQG